MSANAVYELVERPAGARQFARCVEFQRPVDFEAGEHWIAWFARYYRDHEHLRVKLYNLSDGEQSLQVHQLSRHRVTEIRLRRVAP